MTLVEAIEHLERQAAIKLQLANADRRTTEARRIGEKHRKDATAIAMVLAALPQGAR